MPIAIQIAAQLLFLLTGPPMVLLTQYETYIGGNYPLSFLQNVAQYFGMTTLAIIPMLIDYIGKQQFNKTKSDTGKLVKYKPILDLTWKKLKYIFPIALFAVFDVSASSYSYQAVGATIYIVIYSSVTIFTALIRKFYLKKDLKILQWVAIIIITIGLAITSINSELTTFNVELITGIVTTLIAALMDSTMYVFAERALDIEDITEWDVTVGVGLIGSFITILYVSLYCLFGEFDHFIKDPMKRTYDVIIFYWCIDSLAITAHYLSFYFVIKLSSSVTAAVNKAVQSILCLVAASILYCSSHANTCFTWIVAVSAIIINVGTILYAYSANKQQLKHTRKHSLMQNESTTKHLIIN